MQQQQQQCPFVYVDGFFDIICCAYYTSLISYDFAEVKAVIPTCHTVSDAD